jgi:hypothetical protein
MRWADCALDVGHTELVPDSEARLQAARGREIVQDLTHLPASERRTSPWHDRSISGHAHPVPIVLVASEELPADQLAQEAMGRGPWQPSSTSDLGQRLSRAIGHREQDCRDFAGDGSGLNGASDESLRRRGGNGAMTTTLAHRPSPHFHVAKQWIL